MDNPFSRHKKLLANAISLALLSGSYGAFAEEQNSEDEGAESDMKVIQIYAERRTTNLQETPVAVSVLSQDDLAESNIADVTDLTGHVPGLVVSSQEDQSDIKIYIRGVGTNNPTETGDQGVGVYVDGVFAARAQGALALMYDLENVQVLRGPQGTLFGRNNTGGAILLETKKPGSSFDADFQMIYGNYNRRQLSAGITLPITDGLSVRLASYIEQDDGWVDAVDVDPRGTQHGYSGISTGRLATTDRLLNNTDVSSSRVTAVWDFSDNISWLTSYETFLDKGNHGILLNPVLVEDGIYEAFIDSPVSLNLSSDVFRTSLSHDITDSINMEYIAGYSKLKRNQIVDQDAGVTSRFQEGRTEYQHSDAASFEIKIQNTDDGPLTWTTGVYYFEEETAIRFDFDGFGSWLNAEGATFIQPARGSESTAAYAQVGYQVTDKLTLTAGARYTEDLKYDRGGRNIQDCDGEYIRPTLGGSTLSVYEDFLNNRTGSEGADGLDDFTGRERVRGQCAATLRNDVESESEETTYLARASYQYDQKNMFYLSVGSGYRAGVIQDGGNVTRPENSVSYEVGSKSDFDRMRLNLAAFYIDYTDLIRSGFDEDQQQVVNSNVAAAEITGLEAELTWLIGEKGQLNFSGSYLNAEYTDYIVDNGGSGTNNPEILDENGEGTGLFDLSGNKLPQSPEFQISTTLQWEFETRDGVWVPRVSLRWVDDVYFRDQNENRIFVDNIINDVEQTGVVWGNPAGQEAYLKSDLGLSYFPINGNWSLDAYINNVTEEMTRSSTSVDNGTAAGLPGRYASPRTFGIRFNVTL